MLLFEHPSTPEGQLTKRAMRDLKDLREEIKQTRAIVPEIKNGQKVVKVN